jgi:hypothetical protein
MMMIMMMMMKTKKMKNLKIQKKNSEGFNRFKEMNSEARAKSKKLNNSE